MKSSINQLEVINKPKLWFGFLLLICCISFFSYSNNSEKFITNIEYKFLDDTIPPDTLAEDEFTEDTLIYADGRDTIYEVDDSLTTDTSFYFRITEFPLPGTNIHITPGGISVAINRGIYGIHIGGMFDNSTLPNDGSSDYAWQWLVDLAPEVLRFPSGSFSKFMHLLHDPYTGADSKGYGYNVFEIARYCDWTDGTMDFDFSALSGADIIEILYQDDPFQLDDWIKSSAVDHFTKLRSKALQQSCETRRYIDDFIELVNQIDDAYPGRPKTKVILDLNILSETATECRAIADYLRANDVNVIGVEMGNETYADFFCDAMEFHTFNNYWDFINGTNLSGNENVLNDIAGTSADMWGDHDFITAFKTGGGFNYKIGVCGIPLGPDYVFKITEDEDEGCSTTDEWNNALRGKYSEQVSGTSKYKFDAVIMHTYYEPDVYQHIPINNLIPETGACAGESELWQFDEYDLRLKNAYDKIIGIGNESGNFRNFLLRTTPEYKAYKVSMDKFNEYFDFDLTSAIKKDLWTTEWNLKDTDKGASDVDQAKTEIYSNGFTHSHLLLQWWLKNIKINFDGDYRQNFYTYTTLQNFAGGTSTDLISLSDAIERNFYGKNVCPYKDDCGDYCAWDDNYDKRNYHIRRTSYYTTYLFSEIYKQNLKYLPSTFLLGKSNRNVQPTVFIDPAKQFLYVYYSNVKDETQNIYLNTGSLQDFFPASAYVEFGQATITYLQAEQLYSTSGKSSLYNKDYINTCYATYDHPFEITASTESGILPAVITADNSSECTGEYEENGCLSAPPYSLGYFKIPITPYYPPPKLAGSPDQNDMIIYPNPSANIFLIKKITSDSDDEEINITILTMQGKTALQLKTKLNTPADITGLPAGFYQIQIKDGANNRFIKPFIKTD